MKYRLSAAIMIVLLAGAVLWLMTTRKSEHAGQVANNNTSGTVETTHAATAPSEPVSTEETPRIVQDSATSDPTGSVPVKTKSPAHAMILARSSGPEASPGLSPAIVLENMRSMFRQYNSRFGGNPVGNNLEITSVLNGGNPAHAVFLNPEDGLRVNGRGELVDNWDTPYFFHQLSRTEMEIHSAGPDRRMWTSDDLVIK